MTDFVGCYLTKAGLELSAKSGVDIVFTRAETGSGVYISPEGVRELTSLKDKRYDYQLEDVEVKGELADIVFYVTNKGVTEAYKLTEVGVYAKDENSEEILYCVAFAYEDNAETIDAEAAGQITYCQKFCVETKVSADANVSVQIVGTDHEWVKNYFIKYAGEVNLEEGTLQEQISKIKESGTIDVDDELSEESDNPVRNNVITKKINEIETAINGLSFSITERNTLAVTYDDGMEE